MGSRGAGIYKFMWMNKGPKIGLITRKGNPTLAKCKDDNNLDGGWPYLQNNNLVLLIDNSKNQAITRILFCKKILRNFTELNFFNTPNKIIIVLFPVTG